MRNLDKDWVENNECKERSRWDHPVYCDVGVVLGVSRLVSCYVGEKFFLSLLSFALL